MEYKLDDILSNIVTYDDIIDPKIYYSESL